MRTSTKIAISENKAAAPLLSLVNPTLMADDECIGNEATDGTVPRAISVELPTMNSFIPGLEPGRITPATSASGEITGAGDPGRLLTESQVPAQVSGGSKIGTSPPK